MSTRGNRLNLAFGRMRGAGLAALAAAVGLLAAAGAARADELVINGVSQRNVRITGLRDQYVLYETSTGVRRQVAVGDVEAMGLRRYDAVGEAESLAREGRHAEAVERYAAALDEMREGEVKTLVRTRYIAALERAGEVERAVREFVSLVQASQGEVALSARPTRLPRDAETREALAELVRQRQRRTADAVARRALQSLLEQLEGEPAEEETMEADEAEADASPGGGGVSRAQRNSDDPIERLMAQGRYGAALDAVNTAIEERDGTLARRLYQRGVIQGELGEARSGALSLMRVVIHFAGNNAYYIPSLVEAGRLFVELDQPEHARRLWQEARRARGVSDAQLEEIDQLLGSLP